MCDKGFTSSAFVLFILSFAATAYVYMHVSAQAPDDVSVRSQHPSVERFMPTDNMKQ
jgi:hypothetical protein